MTRLRLPKPFELLLFWHGLLAGSYTIAYITAEGAHGLHQFAGYTAVALLAVRLLVGWRAAGRGAWAFPVPRAAQWRTFAGKLASGNLHVLRGRTPFAPLSGLVLLSLLVVVAVTGLLADWFGAEDLHEGPAEASLAMVAVHVAIVGLGPALKRWGPALARPSARSAREA
ncbi:MAG TPA: cytochrome b/b6 domain-containing protein [Gammaproteobacteria bacterium]|nr:cytochrome b/b6 domain-containing protein [Gammaproteobacteria bacterium]